MKSFAYLIQPDAIERSKTDLEKFFISAEISPQNIAKLLIVVDEVVSNIVYHGTSEKGALTISADIRRNELTLVFTDNSHKFNPLIQKEPDISKPTKERDVGGLGILIVKKIADSLSYKYKDECNVLTFIKFI